jgi:hypothetical protein
MIAVRNWFPHGCSSPNGCDDPACSLCANTASVKVRDAVRVGEQATRDGAPKLAAERERGDLAFRKRHRDGPNYVPRNARL